MANILPPTLAMPASIGLGIKIVDPQAPTTREQLSAFAVRTVERFESTASAVFGKTDRILGVTTTDKERCILACFATHTTISCGITGFLSIVHPETVGEWYALLGLASCAGLSFSGILIATIRCGPDLVSRAVKAGVFRDCEPTIRSTRSYLAGILVFQLWAMLPCGLFVALRMLVVMGFVGAWMALVEMLMLSRYVSRKIGDAKVAGVRAIPTRRTEYGWEPVTQESGDEVYDADGDDDDDDEADDESDESDEDSEDSEHVDGDASPEHWAMAAEERYERQIVERTTDEQIEFLAGAIAKQMAENTILQAEKQTLQDQRDGLIYQRKGLVAQLWEAQEARRRNAEAAGPEIKELTMVIEQRDETIRTLRQVVQDCGEELQANDSFETDAFARIQSLRDQKQKMLTSHDETVTALNDQSAQIAAENEELTARVHVMHSTIRNLASRIQPLQQEISQLQLDVKSKSATILRMGSQFDAQTTDLDAAVKKNREWLADHEEGVGKAYRLVDQKDAFIAVLEAKLLHWRSIQQRSDAASAQLIESLQSKLADHERANDQHAAAFPKWFAAQQNKLKMQHSEALASNKLRWRVKWATDLEQLSQKKDEELEAKDQQIVALADQQRHVQTAWHGAHRAELKNAWDNAQFCHQKQKEAEEKLKVLQAASEGWHAVDDAETEAAVQEEAAAKPKECLGAEECKDEGCFCRDVVKEHETVQETVELEGSLLVEDDVDDLADFEGCDMVSLSDCSESDVEIIVDSDSESESESDDDDDEEVSTTSSRQPITTASRSDGQRGIQPLSKQRTEKRGDEDRSAIREEFLRDAELSMRMMRDKIRASKAKSSQ